MNGSLFQKGMLCTLLFTTPHARRMNENNE